MRNKRFLASSRSTDAIESAAIAASGLCLVHCLGLPLLLVLLPGVIGLYVGSEIVHYAALALVAPLALFALRLGYRRHGALCPGVIGGLGIACLTFAVLPIAGERAEMLGTVAGSILLIAAHTINWRLRAAMA